VYNIATQTKISLLDLIEAINNTLIKTQNGFVPIVPTHGPERVGDIRHSMANIERIQTTLGWKPVVVFEDGIEEIVRERLSLK
jgi:nucleoside-diphosphate-sugar epimerase